jgi:predicted XRE-type DNA-binding protein
VKIQRIETDNRKKEFVLLTEAGAEFSFPYARAAPPPTPVDRLAEVFIDDELGREAFTYRLRSGREGTVHVEQVLDYNEEPDYLADLLLYRLTLEAVRRIETSRLSRRQVARQLHTSVPQLYRLLDPSNSGKSMKQLVALLHVLGCEVDISVRQRNAA